jgi:anti-sigma factor RsiW
MTESMHIDTETLSAFADGELQAVASSRVERHLADCDRCVAQLARVRSLVVAAKALPRDVAPPPEVWGVLRERVARESRDRARPARWWHNGWLAAAAAVILVAGTAILTTTAAPSAKAKKVASQTTPSVAEPVANVVRAVDANYASTVSELRATLSAQRPVLAPSTIRVLEHSLAVIDTAIAEARAALSSDPANSALLDVLSAQYERKVDLLQRATKLSPSL